MGVHGLWQLLQSTGRPVSLESLEGKVLAIDVSMWLHQLSKGMRDKDGNPVPNAHLIGLFTRICKLLFYKIKPVFVFDGGVPVLKKQTLMGRREQREFAVKASGKATQKLLANLIRSQAVRAALGSGEGSSSSVARTISSKAKGPDLFELPPLPESAIGFESKTDKNSDTDESLEDRLAYQEYMEDEFQDLDEIDIDSIEFKGLPAEIQHEIISDIRERRKRLSLHKKAVLPEDSIDFSKFQVAKLLKQSKLSNRLESVRKEMNNRHASEFTSVYGEDYFDTDIATQRVVSEDASHYILIKGLKRKREVMEMEEAEKKNTENEEEIINKEKVYVTSSADSSSVDDLLKESEEEAENRRKINFQNADQNSVVCKVVRAQEVTGFVDVRGSDEKVLKNLKVVNNESKEGISDVNEIVDSTLQVITSFEESRAGVLAVERGDKQTECSELGNGEENSITLLHEKSGTGDASRSGQGQTEEDEMVALPAKVGKKQMLEMNSMAKKRRSLSGDSSMMAVKQRKLETTDEEIENTIKEDSGTTVKVDLTKDADQSSDDEFIEITVDPLNAVEDDLFPASIFEVDSQLRDTEEKTLEEDDIEDKSRGVPNEPDRKSPEPVTRTNISDIDEDDEPVKRIRILDSDEEEVVPKDKKVSFIKEDDIEEDLYEKRPTHDIVREFEAITEDDLRGMQHDLEEESAALRAERGRQERLATSLSDTIHVEAQELLRLFGVPYIVSPMEAEAQCAHLDLTDQIHGTITDDSDVWLFGGKRVFRNFFNQKHHVELYRGDHILSQLGLGREKLINIALLCGSDYTVGIYGVGPVTALEILAEFPGDSLQGLKNFKSWWDEAQSQITIPVESKLKSKLRELNVHPGFPNPAVVEAYMKPAVDDSTENFSWSLPDLDRLREFALEKFGWAKTKTDEALLPVMKKLNERQAQARISSYFQPENFIGPARTKSKRVDLLVQKMLNPHMNIDSPTSSPKNAKKSKGPARGAKGRGRGRGKGQGQRKDKDELRKVKSGQNSKVNIREEINLSENSSESSGSENDDNAGVETSISTNSLVNKAATTSKVKVSSKNAPAKVSVKDKGKSPVKGKAVRKGKKALGAVSEELNYHLEGGFFRESDSDSDLEMAVVLSMDTFQEEFKKNTRTKSAQSKEKGRSSKNSKPSFTSELRQGSSRKSKSEAKGKFRPVNESESSGSD